MVTDDDRKIEIAKNSVRVAYNNISGVLSEKSTEYRKDYLEKLNKASFLLQEIKLMID